FVTMGRANGAVVTKTTPVTLSLTGMTPWAPADGVLVDSFAIDTENVVAATSGAPAAGDTKLAAVFDWQKSYTWGTDPSAAKLIGGGDPVWITHATNKIVTDPQGYPWTVGWTADVATLPGVAMQDGSPLTLPSTPTAFTPVDKKLSETFTIDVAGERAAIPDGGRFANEEWSCLLIKNIAVAYG